MRRNFDDNAREGVFSNRQLMARLWPWFRPWLWQFAVSLLLLMIAQLLLILGPWLLKQAIDVDIANHDRVGLRRTMMYFLLVHLVHLSMAYLVRNWLESVGQRMMASLRRKLVDHLLLLPLSFHDRHTPGKLMSRVESDTQALRVLFTTTIVMLLGDALLFLGMFGVMFATNVRLTLLCALILPVMAAMTYYFQQQIHPIFVRVRKLNSEVASRLTELLQTMPIVQAFARERWAVADFQTISRQKFRTQLGGEKQIVVWFNGIRSLQMFAIACVLGIGGYWSLTGLVTVGTLVMFLSYIRRFFEPLQRLSEQLAMIQKAFAAAERLFSILAEPLLIADAPQPQPWPGHGCEVVFENVWFHYGGGVHKDRQPSGETAGTLEEPAETSDVEWILKDVSFRLPARQCFALIGPTGSGKTTIISLLLRFYDPQRGRILIDGLDIRDLAQTQLRQRVGVVMQDIYLFWGNLTANLTLGAAYPEAHIREAARLTASDRFIQQLPGKYASDLSERGGNLSLGQRQLLSFTRAVLRDPELLILDEATSAVDPATELAVAEATRRVMQERTSLVIAHRLSTIRNADQILVLEQGRLIQQGTHAELMATPGLYRRLQELQQVEGPVSS